MYSIKNKSLRTAFKIIFFVSGLLLFGLPFSTRYYQYATYRHFSNDGKHYTSKLYDASKPGIKVRNGKVFVSVDKRYHAPVLVALPTPAILLFGAPSRSVQKQDTLCRPYLYYPGSIKFLRGPPYC